MKMSILNLKLVILYVALFTSVDAQTELPPNLAAKLDYQFEKYDSGNDFLVDRVVKQNLYVNRTEWESFLSPDNEVMVITEDEKNVLVSYHEALVKEAHLKAKEESLIDIDDFRDDHEQVKDFCHKFPRAALLHIHPSGTVERETAVHAFEETNPMIKTDKLMEIGTGDLTMLYPSELEFIGNLTPPVARYLDYDLKEREELVDLLFLPKEPCCHDFPRFEALFKIFDEFFEQSEGNKTWFKDLTYNDFLERNAEFGISYVEFTSVRIPPNVDKLKEASDYLMEQESKHENEFVLNYNVAFVRTISHDDNFAYAQTLIETLENRTAEELSNVVGIDLLAEETNNPALEKAQSIYIPIYDAWKNKGTIELGGMTMHAGEHGEYGPHNVRDAIIMGCTRIGHGVLLFDEPVFLEYNRRKRVPMVHNIASNYRLNVIRDNDLELHPFIEMLRLGIPLTLSTDDEGMFHTDIVNECEIAISNSDIQYSELKRVSYTSVIASFANDTVKETLLAELDAKFESFEAGYKNDGTDSSYPVDPSEAAEAEEMGKDAENKGGEEIEKEPEDVEEDVEEAEEKEVEDKKEDSAAFAFPTSLFIPVATVGTLLYF